MEERKEFDLLAFVVKDIWQGQGLSKKFYRYLLNDLFIYLH